jgi:hypothetical protein
VFATLLRQFGLTTQHETVTRCVRQTGSIKLITFEAQREEKSPVEAGSNTSTIALRVVGGDENGIQCLEL